MTIATKETHRPIKGPDPYSTEWHALRVFDPSRKRPVIIGASEAAAACNVSPYSSAFELYLIKRGEMTKEFSDDQKSRMSLGSKLEPIILDCYEERTSCHLTRRLPMYFHPRHEFMAATPDALACSEVINGPEFDEWVVEAKSTSWRMLDRSGGDDAEKFGEEGTDQVPLSYMLQAQQQMAVMGMHRCDFPVLVDAGELRIYTVHRSDELIKQIALAEIELVERIINADPPEPNFEHTGITNVIRGMFGTQVGKVATLSEEDHDLWLRRAQLKESIKEMEATCNEIDARLAWSMADAEVGRFPDAGIELRKITVAETQVPAFTRKGYSFLKAKKI